MTITPPLPELPFRLRIAGEADLDAVHRLFRSSVRRVNLRDYSRRQVEIWSGDANYSQDWLERIATHYFLLAEDEKGLGGFASITAEGYVDLLFVHPDRQSQGIGTLLLGKLVHRAYAQGLSRLTTEASITARPLFERLGFELVREQQKEFGGVQFTNFIMEKTLNPVEIQSERMLLKRFGPEDIWDFFLLNSDPLVMQYTGDDPFPDWRGSAAFLEAYDPYSQFGYGRMAVLRRTDGQYLGWCGLKYHPDTGETDLGYRFYRKYWNRGYATEASQAVLQYGFKQLKLEWIMAEAEKENTASIRVMEKLGMQFAHPVEFDGAAGVRYIIRS